MFESKRTFRYWACTIGSFGATYLVTGSALIAFIACFVTIIVMTRSGDA